MKLLKKIGMILLCVAVVIGLCFALPRPQASVSNPFLIDAGARPLLIAHGGGNEEFPDNTLEAFYHAYSIDPGCMLETDVSLTKDGVVILCHDRTLDRTTDVSGEIIDWTYADLVSQEVDFGFKNPTNGGQRHKAVRHADALHDI